MKNPITKLLTVTALLGAPSLAFAGVRTLPSGAPACGNTMGKGGFEERECTAQDLKEWKAQAQRAAAKERPAANAARARVQRPAIRAAARPAKPSTRR